MGEACSVNGEIRNTNKILIRKLGRDHSENQVEDGKFILKRILREKDGVDSHGGEYKPLGRSCDKGLNLRTLKK